MSTLQISPSKAGKFNIKIAKDGIFRSADEILTQKGVNMSIIRDIWPEVENYGEEIDEQIEINSHYDTSVRLNLYFLPLRLFIKNKSLSPS